MENLRGALFMTLAMAGFAIEDSFIKVLATVLPTWQIVLILGVGGSLMFGVLTVARGERLWSAQMLSAPVILRNIGELLGVLGMVTALAKSDLSSVSAILQALPLMVTMGAALFLNEPVGWRRWGAVGIGFAGVLLIVRPGLDGFDGNALYAVIAVVGLAIRDVATRKITKDLSSGQLSYLAFLVAVPASIILSAATGSPWVALSGWAWGYAGATIALGGFAYVTLIQATRIGDISFVTPFRYTRIVFALIAGFLVFGERPDTLMLIGTAIIIGSGLYTFARERLRASAAG